MTARIAAWSERKRKSFVADWNDGLEHDAMREKYGGQPSAIAQRLRKKGYRLVNRRPSALALPTRPEDTARQWRHGGAA